MTIETSEQVSVAENNGPLVADKKSNERDPLRAFGLLVIILVATFIIPVIFWKCWSWITGSMPKFLGFSRLWLDTLSFWFVVEFAVAYYISLRDQVKELSKGGKCQVPLWKLVMAKPWLSLIGLFVTADIAISILFSFATGALGCIAFTIIVLIIMNMKKWCLYCLHIIVRWLDDCWDFLVGVEQK